MVIANIRGTQHKNNVKFMKITINVTFLSCARKKEKLVKFMSVAYIRQRQHI